jgi:biotin-dependent carboxylase-like uncharacterized protein
MDDVLTVTKAGISCVQDLGRRGWSRYGLPVNGAADQYSASVANVLVGSPRGAALIEITLLDFAATVSRDTVIALTGAPADVTIDGQPAPQWQPLHIRAGQQVSVRKIRTGLRVYLAVLGQLITPTLAGSAAPDSILGFGRTLTSGEQVLFHGYDLHQSVRRPGPFIPAEYLGVPIPRFTADTVITITEGPDAAEFTEPWEVLQSQRYTITPQSNHVGLRLAGSVPARRHGGEVLSRGVPVGAVEVPSNDQLLVLHRGRGVTAGYPVLAVVTTRSLDLLGQARPGHHLRFRRQQVADAIRSHRVQSTAIDRLAGRTSSIFSAYHRGTGLAS